MFLIKINENKEINFQYKIDDSYTKIILVSENILLLSDEKEIQYINIQDYLL